MIQEDSDMTRSACGKQFCINSEYAPEYLKEAA